MISLIYGIWKKYINVLQNRNILTDVENKRGYQRGKNKLGICNYTIGLNDLTSSLLFSHRNLDVYSINNPVVYKVVKYVCDKVHNFNKELTVAGYLNKEMLDFCIENNISFDILHSL